MGGDLIDGRKRNGLLRKESDGEIAILNVRSTGTELGVAATKVYTVQMRSNRGEVQLGSISRE